MSTPCLRAAAPSLPESHAARASPRSLHHSQPQHSAADAATPTTLSAADFPPAAAKSPLSPGQHASKRLKSSSSPDSAIPIYSSSSPAATRSPAPFDSDLSSTPIDLQHLPQPSDLLSPLPAAAAAQPAAAPLNPPSSSASDLAARVQGMFQESDSKSSAAVSEQKSNSSAHKSSMASTSASASASAATSAANSAANSKNPSRAHSPNASMEDASAAAKDEPMSTTSGAAATTADKPSTSSSSSSSHASSSSHSSSSSHTAHPRPTHTSKSTDPAGAILEAELGGRYKVLRYLGKGSYGTVFVAEEVGSGKQFAIKKIPRVFDNLTNAKRLLRELKILRMLSHHNVIGYKGLLPPVVPATFNSLLIVFEFVDTDLAKLLASDQPITNQHVQYFLYQLLCGINYIHSANIIHRDIKPANVLINADCSLKICDFGLSRSTLGPNPSAAAKRQAEDEQAASRKQAAELAAAGSGPKLGQRQVSTEKVSLAAPQKLARELTKHVVTRWYRAPEVILLSDRYTTAIDMWSIGCIFSELLSMQTRTSRRALFPGRTCFPFSADNNPLAYTDQLDQLNVIFDVIGTPTKEEIEKIDNDRARSYLRSLPFKPKIDLARRFAGADPLAVDLLQKLLFFDPSKRFTAQQALAHPYLAEFRQVEDEGTYAGGAVDFAFEDGPVNKDQIKSLIVDQILLDNPSLTLREFFPSGTTVGSAQASILAAQQAAKEAKEREMAESHKRKMAEK